MKQAPDIVRRGLLKAGVGAATLFLPQSYAWVWAQTDGTVKLLRAPKQALVIGNSSYSQSPLKNPANDARAIGEALKGAGFDVTTKLDAPLSELAQAVQAYTQSLAKRQAVGIFYFAGHGLQLAWRNYMVPVDARMSEASDVQKTCVELGDLLSGIFKAKNPLNVIILDACRDNPFGNLKGLDQKGLSQMDAPPSTLLAYATAPGNVADDGSGANGLYTEHLLKEILVPEARVEDVFKRVRLHVRKRTNGQQIPWESTSLEEDYYIVPPKALSVRAAEETERERREELARLEKQRQAEEAERKRKLAEAQRLARLAAEEEESKRKEELAALEAKRAAGEAERKRQQELALKEAQRTAEEAERKRREDQVRLAAQRAEEEAGRRYKEELARREKRHLADEAERKRKDEHTALEAKRAADEAERKYKEEVALREKRAEEARQKAQQGQTIRKPTEAQLEREFAEELAIWEKIKESPERGPLEDYLLRYPSGKFSELAQFQLDRVLARVGERKITIASAAGNPYTKGTVRTDTNFKVGDFFRYRMTDFFTKLELRTYTDRVTGVGDYELQFNKGGFVTDLLGNFIRNANVRYTGTQFYLPEYTSGKRWSAKYLRQSREWPTRGVSLDFKVVDREKITVPAGVFDAYKIEGSGWTRSNNDAFSISLKYRYWMAENVRRAVAFETINRNQTGYYDVSGRRELIAFKQG